MYKKNVQEFNRIHYVIMKEIESYKKLGLTKNEILTELEIMVFWD